MSAVQHPFKAWLLANHADENTPIGDLAGDVGLDPNFPTKGNRQALLRHVEEVWGASAAFLDCFEAAWRLYEPIGEHPFESQRRIVGNTLTRSAAIVAPNSASTARSMSALGLPRRVARARTSCCLFTRDSGTRGPSRTGG